MRRIGSADRFFDDNDQSMLYGTCVTLADRDYDTSFFWTILLVSATMTTMRAPFIAGLILAVSAVLSGCGSDTALPELGEVSGTVTLDDKPASNMEVRFEPQDKGGTSSGVTDAEGKYTLTYLGEQPGAVVGTHTVRIIGVAGGGPAGGETGEVVPDVPARYNTESVLTEEVKEGPNEINFDLKTGQP